MGPSEDWVAQWRVGVDADREEALSRGLLRTFLAFWRDEKLDDRSKTTRYRYEGGLCALGGYLVEKGTTDEDEIDKSAADLLWEAVRPGDGPLVFHDHETWQDELDAVCRKLKKYLARTRIRNGDALKGDGR